MKKKHLQTLTPAALYARVSSAGRTQVIEVGLLPEQPVLGQETF